MKRKQLTFALFALLITTLFAGTASAQFGGLLGKAKEKIDKVKQEVEAAKQAKKDLEQLAGKGGNKNTKNQPPPNQTQNNYNSERWITFSKTHTRNNEAHIMSMNTLGCGDSIFATVNYREPVDNSNGYTISMLVDGELVLKERMSGGSATSVNQTIHIEVIPAEDAVEGYPKVTLRKAKNILDKLPQGDHTLQISVSLTDDPSNAAVGEIQYTGGAGCNMQKPPRKPDTTKNTTKIENNAVRVPDYNHVRFMNNCSEDRKINYLKPDGSFSVIYITAGFPYSSDFPVGTKFWHGNMQTGDPFLVMPASQYTVPIDIARTGPEIKFCD